jgi:predicted nucleic acid-binding protein
MKSLTFCLDSNAWIALAKNQSGYQELLSSYVEGVVRVRLTQLNIDELLDPIRVSPDNIIKNIQSIFPFANPVERDSIFSVDFSRLDSAILSTVDEAEVYDRHLLGKKATKRNIRDAIHLVNSRERGAVLVSCDAQLRATARKEDIKVICISGFIKLVTGQDIVPCQSLRC